ncbi:MAG: DNA alkylation repair protein [Nanoarchaeota archaeon]
MHEIQLELRKYAKPEKIPIYKNFFKTGKGEYGEGDEFLGITVPDTRRVAKNNVDVSFEELTSILKSNIHEDRMCALLILVYKYEKADSEKYKKEIIDFYIKNHLYGNNWDLIDCVADKLLGKWLIDKNKDILYNYAKSNNLWERRIAIISTFHFIKNNEFKETLKIAKVLLSDGHDLIHKAVGWMLREVGKRESNILESFLKNNYKNMPRTMLRYAIEKFPEDKRQLYLKGKI